MNSTELWLKNLENVCQDFENVILTELKFVAGLEEILAHDHSPVVAVHFQIACGHPFGDISIGNLGEGDPTESYSDERFDNNGASCRIKVWRKPGNSHSGHSVTTSELKAHLLRLIKSFWKPQLRDDKSRLISLHIPDTTPLLDNSLTAWADAAESLKTFVFFCDLDKFKSVNDTFGQTTGDRVILEFASLINNKCSPKAVALHNGGDEFSILYPAQDVEDALSLTETVMRAVAEYNFNVGEIKVGVSVGFVQVKKNEELSYAAIVDAAEKVLKPVPGTKHRGQARISSLSSAILPDDSNFARNTALCLIKSCVHSVKPFESPWLNLISQRSAELVVEGSWQQLNTEINKLILWMQPRFANNVIRASLSQAESGDYEPVFSKVDVAFAAAHGIYRAVLIQPAADFKGKSLMINAAENQNDVALKLNPDNLMPFCLGDVSNNLLEILNLGGFVSSIEQEKFDARRAFLIKIGHKKLNIPDSLFIEEIVVDDRPTRGGGLPDFWEATIAKLISLSNKNVNVAAVYVLGEHKYGTLTVEKLKTIADWKHNIEQISYKTEMPVPSIATAVERLEGKIHFPSDEQELVNNFALILENSCRLEENSSSLGLHREQRFLRRELSIGEMALGKYDGCRVNTIAEAFPVVLDIARQLIDEKLKIIDQAGEEFQELVDFKVHLKNPKKDRVPAFYQSEQNSLEDYFEKEFLSEKGLFGKVFKDSGQLDAVLNHLAEAATNTKHKYSTRRAVLIVPNEIKPDEEFTPLGLISIRIIPRFAQNSIVLNYSYTWRTVEALVGFPYSLYGSVKYSEYLTEEFRKRLPEVSKRNLNMGEVSYIAHSLHIFMDEYRQSIARRIIDNASF